MSMIPSEEYPEGQQDIWTPAVWSTGPDKLVNDAKSQLWQDNQDMEGEILNGSNRAMSGNQTAPQNETDEIIAPTAPKGRASQWQSDLQDLRRDEPLAAWSSGTHDGPANPAP